MGRGSAVALVALVVLFSGRRLAEACSCNENPPCAAVWRADAVFVGRAGQRVAESLGGTLSWTVQTIVVDQPLHGAVDPLVTIVPGVERPTAEQIEKSRSSPDRLSVSSSCDYLFEAGQRYLIYARKTADGRWTTSSCSGTKLLERAVADLAYIDALPTAPDTGRVFGSIDRIVADPDDPSAFRTVPAAGVAVELVGSSNRFVVSTNAEGTLDLQVPPGEYTVVPVVPEAIRVYGAPRRGAVPARGCLQVRFGVTANGRIEGRVVQQDGLPLARAHVDVIAATPPSGKASLNSRTQSASTDAEGRFRVDAILPGPYVIAVNARSGPRLDSPYSPTYFPGVSREQAEIVDVGEGERKAGFTIVVNRVAETTITGTVVLDDNRPAADVPVRASLVDHRGWLMSTTTTDSRGAFQLRVLAGMTYVISAIVNIPNANGRAEVISFVPEEGVVLSIRR
jgi:hypothetical protein